MKLSSSFSHCACSGWGKEGRSWRPCTLPSPSWLCHRPSCLVGRPGPPDLRRSGHGDIWPAALGACDHLGMRLRGGGAGISGPRAHGGTAAGSGAPAAISLSFCKLSPGIVLKWGGGFRVEVHFASFSPKSMRRALLDLLPALAGLRVSAHVLRTPPGWTWQGVGESDGAWFSSWLCHQSAG